MQSVLAYKEFVSTSMDRSVFYSRVSWITPMSVSKVIGGPLDSIRVQAGQAGTTNHVVRVSGVWVTEEPVLQGGMAGWRVNSISWIFYRTTVMASIALSCVLRVILENYKRNGGYQKPPICCYLVRYAGDLVGASSSDRLPEWVQSWGRGAALLWGLCYWPAVSIRIEILQNASWGWCQIEALKHTCVAAP